MTFILNLFKKNKLFKKLHTHDGHLAKIYVEKTPHLMTTRLYHIRVYSKARRKEAIWTKTVTGDLLAQALVMSWRMDRQRATA